MGIFNFFRKIVKKDRAEKTVKEKISFSGIEDWIEEKRKGNKLKEKEILVIIKETIRKFVREFREKIVILESVDVESKKENDSLKGIVNNSRKDYIKSVENFLENLNNLEINEFEEYMKKINKIFLDFNKSSHMNYERTTILIGKEMGNIKKDLKVFSKELINIFDENRGIINLFKRMSLIKSKLNMIPPLDRTLEKISETMLSLNKKINGGGEKNKKLLQEIEKIKESSNYLERLRTQKNIGFLKEELKNDIFMLKQLLDFKALTNFFHINKEQMIILKNHKEDFQTNFQKDNGKMIIDLLNESKLNNNNILEKVNLIRIKIEEISNYEKNINEDETQGLHFQIKDVVMEISNLKIEKSKEEKRDERIRANRKEMIDSLKQEFVKMDVELI